MLPENTRRSLPMALLHAREAVMARFRPMLAAHEVTEQQWRVLRVLSKAGPVEATELADRASVMPPSLTRIIKALEGRKFITRNKAQGDGRRVVLTIAPAGSTLIEALSPKRLVIYRDIEQRFGQDRLEQLLDLLESLVDGER